MLVSIITPSFNQGIYIEDNIKSVMNQDYSQIEHIIIDGGSSDNTISILKKYENKYNLYWISERDKGQSDAINKGFKAANGEIIGWINSDDAYLSKDTISKVVDFFEKKKDANIIFGDYACIDEKNCIKYLNLFLPNINNHVLRKKNVVPQPSTFFRKSIKDSYRLNENLSFAMDYDFWLRISFYNKFYHINEVLSCFRLHGESKSISQDDRMRSEALYVASKYKSNLDIINHYSSFIFDVMHLSFKYSPIAMYKIYKFCDKHDFAFEIVMPSRAKLIRNNILLI